MDVAKKIYQYAQPNMSLIGWMGFLGFPIYYYVWVELFPQPYENLPLRLFCSLLFLGVALRAHFPRVLAPFLPHYYLMTVAIGLPLFFSYMMFMNDWSTVWALSLMASCFLHILLVHQTWVILLQAFLAMLIALIAAYGFDIDAMLEDAVWAYVPTFIFTYVFGNICYFRNQVEHETKVSIAKAFGASIAHEMRNPLAALRSINDVLLSILPSGKLGDSERYELSKQEIEIAREVLSDADNVITTGNDTIDLLLTSIDKNRISNTTFKQYSIQSVVEHAIETFAYKKASDRRLVKLNVKQDTHFFGSDTLLKYLIFNLMKNAFYYRRSGDFYIEITVDVDEFGGKVLVKDNGAGMSQETINHVFEDFYTFGKSGSFGLGLPFCKRVMTALFGDITCESELDAWTEFTLSFPAYDSEEVSTLKSELIQSKSILYIGNKSKAFTHLSELSFYQNFKCDHLMLDIACDKQEYEFEYDLIVLDLDAQRIAPDHFHLLEAKLQFTEGRIACIYDERYEYVNQIDKHLQFTSIEKRQLIERPREVIEQLLFEWPSMDRSQLPTKSFDMEKTIIVADDNDSLRNYTSILLEQQGFTVVQAHDGTEVLDVLKARPIDLVLMDIEMPVLDGIQTTRKIRSSKTIYSDMPIIAHTGDSSEVNTKKLEEAGMNALVVKPADTKVLLNTIADWV